MNTLHGQRLGQYDIISLLGEGGMASVYRAYQPAEQRDVAIKILKPTLASDDVVVRRFDREAKTGIALDHPNIVKAFDFGQQDDLLYLVMALMTGGNLNSLIHQEQLQIPRYVEILEQIASALDYAHGRSVVHRDVKPLNILFDAQGSAHMADFGIARILTETTIVGPVETTAGTRPYMAPEQWSLNFIDAQTDIYAFGVTAFEMLAGTLPFTGPALSEAILKNKPLTPLSIRQFRPELPNTLDPVFQRAMARDREDRFPTAEQFVDEVKQALKAFDSRRPTPLPAFVGMGDNEMGTYILTASPPISDVLTPVLATVQQAEAIERLEHELTSFGSRRSLGRVVGLLPQEIRDRFRGRKRDQTRIAALVRGSARLISIYGRGGVGKTALACKVLGDLEAADEAFRPTGMVYLSASTRDDLNNAISLDSIFSSFAQLLPGDTGLAVEAARADPLLPVHRKIAALLTALHRGRYVLLLDNLDSIQDPSTGELTDPEMRAFFDVALEQTNSLCIIVTSREPLTLSRQLKTREHAISLDAGLPVTDAVALLRSFDPSGKAGLKQASTAKLRVFVDKTDGSPRALEAIAGLLLNDAIYSVDDLLADEHLLAQEVAAVTVGEALSRFSPGALRVMQALAVFGRPVKQVVLEFLLAPYIQIDKLHSLLNRLVLSRFISYDQRVKSFSLHPIDQEYCYERIPVGTLADKPGPEVRPIYSRAALHFRAADFYARQRKPEENWKSIDDLGPQLAEFDHLFHAEDYEAAAALLFTIDRRLLSWGHYTRLITLYKSLRERVTSSLYRRSVVNNLGAVYERLGQITEAQACYEEALASARQDKHRRHEIFALANVANMYLFFWGNIDKGIALYQEHLLIDEETRNISGKTCAVSNLGAGYFALGQYEKAIELYGQCQRLTLETGDTEWEIEQLFNTGEALTAMEDYETAIPMLRKAVIRATETNYARGFSYATAYLLNAFIASGRLDEAFQLVSSLKDTDITDNRYYFEALKGIGLLRLQMTPEAAQAFTRSKTLTDELISRTAGVYPVLYARGLAHAGLALTGLETLNSALADYAQAKAICGAKGVAAANLRLIDELMLCEGGERLRPVRALLVA